MLYLTIDTLGPLAEVRAVAFPHHSDNGLADVTAVLIKTKGQHTALLTAIGVTPDYYRFVVFGTEGWIELRDDTQLIQLTRDGSREHVTFDPVDAERAEVEAFAAAIAGVGTFPVPVGDAVHGVAALEAIAEAARTSNTVTL
jgi:predicted dehydrogenase